MNNFLKTDLRGKINNLPSFKNEALLPLFEAVTNSIQAIEERGIDNSVGYINIRILRDSQMLDSADESPIKGFKIEDNGIGFDQKNFDSFLTSDSIHKIDKGCKGVGRFFWLKAFDEVKIESTFKDNELLSQRTIMFTAYNGIEEIENKSVPSGNINTVVSLLGFKEEYRKQPTAYKTAKKIAQRVLEHCLSYFICDKIPSVKIIDNGTTIDLNNIFKSDISQHILTQPRTINKYNFSYNHIKLYSTTSKLNSIVLCANYRDVLSENISNILGVASQFDDKNSKFVYAVYVTSDYLDQHIDSSRMSFDIPNDSGLLKEDYPVSMDELKRDIIICAKDFLKEYLSNILIVKKEIVEKYVADKNPALRSVAHYCPEIYLELEPNSSEEKIDEVLYKYKGKAEFNIRKQSEKLLRTQAKSISEIKDVYEKLTSQIEDFQKDQLSGYIVLRKLIIDLLDRKLELNKDGKYHNEDIVHDIIFPRKSTTDLITYEDHNLWLIDERLTFHTFASSDLPLNQISDSDSTERPDVIMFSEIDVESRNARCVSIIELKKPQRTNFDEDPTKQLLRYVRNIKDQKVKMLNGRNLLVDYTTRFYCYAVCDINDKIKEFAENNNFAELKGELGFYSYNSKLNTHIEILAFDKIVIDAKKRHKMFFDKLGIK